MVRAEGEGAPPPAPQQPNNTAVAKVDRSKDFLYVGSDAAALKYLDGTLPGDYGELWEMRGRVDVGAVGASVRESRPAEMRVSFNTRCAHTIPPMAPSCVRRCIVGVCHLLRVASVQQGGDRRGVFVSVCAWQGDMQA